MSPKDIHTRHMKFSSLPLFTATAALWAAAAPLAAQAQTDPVDTVVGALSTLFQTGFSLQSTVSALNATNFPDSGPVRLSTAARVLNIKPQLTCVSPRVCLFEMSGCSQ